jgi:hypothetical protein
MICLASLSSIVILGLELVVTTDQVLCCEPIVKFVILAIVADCNYDADCEKYTNYDDVNSKLSV